MDNGGMELDIIKNRKVEDGKPVIQVSMPLFRLVSHLLQTHILAGDGSWCRHQTLQQRTRCQRPTFPLLARQKLLRPAPYQERHLHT